MEQKAEEQILTLRELRQRLKCSESMVRKMVRNGLPKIKIGNEYRFYLSKVVSYLETK
jgi:excisionase family DNA binding protein